MGTDVAGRDLLARVLPRRTDFPDGRAHFDARLARHRHGLRGNGRLISAGGVDEAMMRIVDVLYSIPYMMLVIVLLALFGGRSPIGQLVLLFIALGSVSWLTHGAHRPRAGDVDEEARSSCWPPARPV
jgi:oligopeptide transport system permease protein